jgi:hypothetical protein
MMGTRRMAQSINQLAGGSGQQARTIGQEKGLMAYGETHKSSGCTFWIKRQRILVRYSAFRLSQ